MSQDDWDKIFRKPEFVEPVVMIKTTEFNRELGKKVLEQTQKTLKKLKEVEKSLTKADKIINGLQHLRRKFDSVDTAAEHDVFYAVGRVSGVDEDEANRVHEEKMKEFGWSWDSQWKSWRIYT